MRELSKAHDYIASNQMVIDLIESETAPLEKYTGNRKNCPNAMYKDGYSNIYCGITNTECFDCKDMMNMLEDIPTDFLGIPCKEVEVMRE